MYNNKSCALPFSLFPINFNCTMWNRWSFYFSCHCYYYLICLDIHANGNANTRTDAMKFPHVILNCPSQLITKLIQFALNWICQWDICIFKTNVENVDGCSHSNEQWATSTQHFVYLCNVVSLILLGVFFGCGCDYV